MEIMEWILGCYYLKNILDSYGISVIMPVNIPEFFDTDIGRVLKETHDKFKNELLLSEEENFHITLFPIMNSIFVLPENKECRKLCLKVMTHLQKTITDSVPQKDIHTFHRLIKSKETSHHETVKFFKQKWEEICFLCAILENTYTTPFPFNRHLLNNLNEIEIWNKSYSVKEHTVLISSEGCVRIKIDDILIKSENIIRLYNYLKTETRTLSVRFHISLAQIRTLSAYHYLERRIRECERNSKLIIRMKEPEIVAYKHRSLSSVIRKKYLHIPLEV